MRKIRCLHNSVLVLRTILDEGEQKVPSTTASIMAAIRQEQHAQQDTSTMASRERREEMPITPTPSTHEIKSLRPRRIRRTIYSVLALVAVAVVLIASFGLFSSFSAGRYTGSSTSSGVATSDMPPRMMTKYPSRVLATTATWSAVIITYRINDTTVIANYDPLSGKYVILATPHSIDTVVDGISHDGHDVLYSVYDGSQTAYYLYSQSTSNPLYITSERGGSAIWSTDDRYVFINTSQGVAQVEVQTHHVNLILPALASNLLLNYRDGYLYFVKGYEGQAYSSEGTFNRVNIITGEIQQITSCQHAADFWLSPSDVTVYYACPDLQPAIYAVRSDGTGAHTFRSDASKIVGYAADGSPLTTVADAEGKYQVVQRNLLSPSQDKVLLKDVAPGATAITADAIAVAPFGYVLVAKGTYSGNDPTKDERLWYGDLVAGTSQPLYLPQGAHTPQAVGWDRLQVPANMLTSTP